MTIRNSQNGFGAVGLFIHWAMALLMVAGFISGEVMEHADKAPQGPSALSWHIIIGVVILGLVTLRILWRRLDPPPALPATMPTWEVKLSWLVHMALYGVMIALPVTGLLAVFTINNPIPITDSFTLMPLYTSEFLSDGFEEIHEALVGLMLASVGLHTIGAVWHRYVSKDGVMERMVPFLKQPQV